MRISLCVILAVVHAARVRRISPNEGLDSKHRVTYSGNPHYEALVAGNRSTSLLQLKPFDEKKVKAALVAAIITGRAIAQSRLTAKTDRSLVAAEAALAVNAALAAAIPLMAVARARTAAETEFEEALSTAITEIMTEEKAMAKAAHDQVYHHGYYRAVKAEAAAKAAAEAAAKAIEKASKKAKVSGSEVVLKKLLGLTKLGRGATMKQLLEHLEKQVEAYAKNIDGKFRKYPEMVGLEEFLELITATDLRILRVKFGLSGVSGTRKDQAFDNEAMTDTMLAVIQVMVRAVYFDFQVKHKAGSTPRALQRVVQQEMSNKMKSEIGLDGFLKQITELEKHYQMCKEQEVKAKIAAKVEK